MKTDVTLKINSVVMDYLKEISKETNCTIEETVERYIGEILDYYEGVQEK